MNTSKYEAVVEAARNIRHWHDAMNGDGMIVSSEAVRELWKALDELDKHNQIEFSGACVYKFPCVKGYLMLEDEGVFAKEVIKKGFKTRQEAQAYMTMFTGDKTWFQHYSEPVKKKGLDT